MNIEQEKMIVEALPSLYPLKEFEEKAIHKVIDALPPAQPKTGKWILDRNGAFCCSNCMEPCAGYVMMRPRDKFCKMCGAKMEVTT